jgi:hypothetical protein
VRDIIVALATGVAEREANATTDRFVFEAFPVECYLAHEDVGLSVCQCTHALLHGPGLIREKANASAAKKPQYSVLFNESQPVAE